MFLIFCFLGYSKASLDVSPSGHLLFHGYLDTTVPQTGKIEQAGYAYLGSYKSVRQMVLDSPSDELEGYTHIVLRVRGDGRRYFLQFDTSEKLDITFFNRNQFMLYTHGGPYWQDIKIPISRFYFHYKGYLQDEQYRLNLIDVKNIGIVATDIHSGPFRLEIDYIAFTKETQYRFEFDYEGYYHEQVKFKTLGSV